MTDIERCIQLLDDIMIVGGKFDYEAAMNRLHIMRNRNEIDTMEYLNLVDACNHRNEDGHYRNSMIYKRAEGTR